MISCAHPFYLSDIALTMCSLISAIKFVAPGVKDFFEIDGEEIKPVKRSLFLASVYFVSNDSSLPLTIVAQVLFALGNPRMLLQNESRLVPVNWHSVTKLPRTNLRSEDPSIALVLVIGSSGDFGGTMGTDSRLDQGTTLH